MAGFLAFAVDACDWYGRVIRGAVAGCISVLDGNAGYLSPAELLTEALAGLVRGGWEELCGEGGWKEGLKEGLPMVIVDKEERVVGGAEQETRSAQHREDVSAAVVQSDVFEQVISVSEMFVQTT